MEPLAHIAATFPAAVKIGGRRLAPPTLGQWRMLEAAGSPFASSAPREATADDVRVALEILAAPWRRTMRRLRRPRLFGLRAWLLGLGASAKDGRNLMEWLDCAWKTPERFVKDGDASGVGFSPCSSMAARYAMRANRLSLRRFVLRRVESVWDLTVPEALWGCVVAAELDGAEFESEDEAGITTVTSTVTGEAHGDGQ